MWMIERRNLVNDVVESETRLEVRHVVSVFIGGDTQCEKSTLPMLYSSKASEFLLAVL